MNQLLGAPSCSGLMFDQLVLGLVTALYGEGRLVCGALSFSPRPPGQARLLPGIWGFNEVTGTAIGRLTGLSR